MGVSVPYHSNPSVAVIAAAANRTDATSYTLFYAAIVENVNVNVNMGLNDC